MIIASKGLSVEAVGLLLQTTGAGQSIAQTGNGIWSNMFQVSTTYWLGKLPALGLSKLDAAEKDRLTKGLAKTKRFCNYIHCDVASKTQEAKGSWYMSDWGFTTGSSGSIQAKLGNNGPGEQKTAGDYFSNLNIPDVGNSLIMSLATQCWSGVVYNLNKYREIDCGYLECLKEQALNGASIAPCEQAKGVKMCRAITGEIFELPYIRSIKNLLGNINKLIQAPTTLLINKLQASACQGTDTKVSIPGFACHLMKQITLLKDYQSVTQHNMLFSFPYQADLCQKALCEGDACDRTTSSFLEQLAPGLGYTGDQYRQQYYDERAQRARQQQYAKLIDDLGKQQQDAITLTPAMEAYGKTHGMKTAKEQQAFFQEVLYGCGNNQAGCTRNFKDMLKKGQEPRSKEEFDTYNKQTLSNAQEKPFSGFDQIYKKLGKDITCDEKGCAPTSCGTAADPKKDSTCKDLWNVANTFNKQRGDYVACQKQADGKTVWQLCEGSCTGTCYSHEATTAPSSAAELQQQQARTEAFYGWVDRLGSVLVSYLAEKGQLDVLRLSSWGDWGAQISGTANKVLNPEQWQDDLCNPNGRFQDFTDDAGSVYAWQEGSYRAILTFAGEILPIGERATGAAPTYLYTVSGVAVSPEEDNELRVTLEPGGRAVTLQGAASLSLEKGGTPVSFSASLNDTTRYDQVCVAFASPFPRPGGDTRYCRTLRASAYDRGGVTNATLPEQPDAYRQTWATSSGQPSTLSTSGVGTSGTGTSGGGFG